MRVTRRQVAFEHLGSTAQPVMMPTVGEETVSVADANSSRTQATGVLKAVYFRARRTETINGVVVTCVGAAGATPTLCRIGIYSVATADWALTGLLASTPNDTGLFAAANEEYAKALSAPLSKVAGTWYAVAVLVVTPAAAPTLAVQLMAASTMCLPTNNRPRKCFTLSGQADLPASVAAASMAVESGLLYVLLTP